MFCQKHLFSMRLQRKWRTDIWSFIYLFFGPNTDDWWCLFRSHSRKWRFGFHSPSGIYILSSLWFQFRNKRMIFQIQGRSNWFSEWCHQCWNKYFNPSYKTNLVCSFSCFPNAAMLYSMRMSPYFLDLKIHRLIWLNDRKIIYVDTQSIYYTSLIQ